MIRKYLTVERLALPPALLAGGILLGPFFEKTVLRNIRKKPFQKTLRVVV